MSEETAARYSRTYFEELPLKELIVWLNRQRDYYYNGKAKVSDAVFDMAEDILRERSPKNKYFAQVGAPVKTGKKEKLPIPLGSLDKVKDEKLQAWLDKAGNTIILSDKIDGASALYSYLDDEPKLHSRGDKVIGQNISSLIDVAKGFGKLRKGEAVRGELVLPNKSFSAALAKKFENTRNLTSGIVNSKDSGAHPVAGKLFFIAHEMVRPNKALNVSGPYLKKKGFKVAPYKVLKNPTISDIQAYFAERKRKAPYEIDGLVMYSPKAGTIAYKVEGDVAETVVRDIDWKLTRFGVYAPTLSLDPVRLVGVTIRNATAYNARYIKEMGIGPGAIVVITRSNDVIPKVVSVTKKAKMKWPDGPYEWTVNAKGEKVNLKLPDDEEEPEKILVERITSGIAKLGVDGIRSGAVSKLVANGVATSMLELLQSDVDEFIEAGIGNTNASKLYRGLHDALKRVDHATMMAASGLFPKGLGESKFADIMGQYSFEALSKLTAREVMNTVAEIPGFSSKTALIFAKGFREYRKFIKTIGWKPVKKQASKNDPLVKETVTFTGFRNKSLDNIIKGRGGKVSASFSKKTTILLVPTASHNSDKVSKAKASGTTVMPLEKFLSKFKIKL